MYSASSLQKIRVSAFSLAWINISWPWHKRNMHTSWGVRIESWACIIAISLDDDDETWICLTSSLRQHKGLNSESRRGGVGDMRRGPGWLWAQLKEFTPVSHHLHIYCCWPGLPGYEPPATPLLTRSSPFPNPTKPHLQPQSYPTPTPQYQPSPSHLSIKSSLNPGRRKHCGLSCARPFILSRSQLTPTMISGLFLVSLQTMISQIVMTKSC